MVTGIKVGKVDSCKFLQIGAEVIEITDYNFKSSADGTTELLVTIKGIANVAELSANLELQKKEFQQSMSFVP